MADFQFLQQRARTRKPLPGELPVLDDFEQRWRDAYSNSIPRILMSNGEWLVAACDVRPIIVYPRYLRYLEPS
jgi:hypothetical protein